MTLFGLLGVLSIALVVGQLASVQHAALMTFYDATGCSTAYCPRFAANELCSGNGIRCNGPNVVSLELLKAALTGTISSAVGQLTALTLLNLYYNGLTGTIPSAVGQLTALTGLSFGENAGLVGTIPTAFSRLTNLVSLGLQGTQLNGTIPQTTAPLPNFCLLDSTFLDCASKPKSSCSCSARLQGDDCENRRPISTGSTSVSTVNATTNSFSGSCTIVNDAWWEWTASCTGSATISACGLAPTNTMLGIYRGACPSTSTPTATTESGSEDCDDFGSCGGSGQEQAALAVVSGERIIIRLGTTTFGSTATGTLSISCSGITTAPTTTTAAAATTVADPTTQAVSPSVGATTITAPATTAAAVTGPTTLAVTAMPIVMGTTANASATAAPSTNASISASAPAATPSSGADVALIAGAAGGGAAALLLLAGLIVFFVCRARKAKAGNNERAPAGGGNELRESNYGPVAVAPNNEYDVGDVGQLPASNQYGRINAAEARYSDPGVLQAGGGGIQVKQTGVGTEYSAL